MAAQKKLQSDNGGEFVSHVLEELCLSLKIRIIHGRLYHPQSQGQVERLNKKIAFDSFLNKKIPFEVFFGRFSHQCSIADRGAVAVWPSDEFMAFMRDSRSKHEPRTETFEKGTTPQSFGALMILIVELIVTLMVTWRKNLFRRQ